MNATDEIINDLDFDVVTLREEVRQLLQQRSRLERDITVKNAANVLIGDVRKEHGDLSAKVETLKQQVATLELRKARLEADCYRFDNLRSDAASEARSIEIALSHGRMERQRVNEEINRLYEIQQSLDPEPDFRRLSVHTKIMREMFPLEYEI